MLYLHMWVGNQLSATWTKLILDLYGGPLSPGEAHKQEGNGCSSQHAQVYFREKKCLGKLHIPDAK